MRQRSKSTRSSFANRKEARSIRHSVNDTSLREAEARSTPVIRTSPNVTRRSREYRESRVRPTATNNEAGSSSRLHSGEARPSEIGVVKSALAEMDVGGGLRCEIDPPQQVTIELQTINGLHGPFRLELLRYVWQIRARGRLRSHNAVASCGFQRQGALTSAPTVATPRSRFRSRSANTRSDARAAGHRRHGRAQKEYTNAPASMEKAGFVRETGLRSLRRDS